MEIKNKKMDDDVFQKERQKVLSTWYTGKEVQMEEAIRFHNELPWSKNVVKKMMQAKANGTVLAQPRSGTGTLALQKELLQYLEISGADILPVTIDSYTRTLQFEQVDTLIKESEQVGKSKLNGFPIVNYGVKAFRSLVNAVSSPVMIRTNAIDARLSAEIGLAAGATAFVAGPISTSSYYSKDASLEQAIFNWQYIFRLEGLYQENGINLAHEVYGVLKTLPSPPSLEIAGEILELLIAAEQGVKYLGANVVASGNLAQDIAAMQVLSKVCREYLDMFGYNDVEFFPVLSMWGGYFPENPAYAYGIICLNTIVAAFGDATMIMVKSIEEGVGVPTKEANGQSLQAVKQVLGMLQDQKLDLTKFMINNESINIEKEYTYKEVKAIVNKVIELGNGDPAIGLVKAVESGVIDAPLSPNKNYACKVLPLRDSNGACRYYEFGNLPFNKDIKDFHREKLSKRLEQHSSVPAYELLTKDIFAMGSMGLIGKVDVTKEGIKE